MPLGRRPGLVDEPAEQESIAVLLLPAALERFERAAHAQSLLDIPRVVALEPGRGDPPRFMRDAARVRQARRLRFPGRVRALVLYHPAQYPLARALRDRHPGAELWYLPPPPAALDALTGADAEDARTGDELARHHAHAVLEPPAGGEQLDGAPLRARLLELDVISPYAFDPRARRR
jgi:hypothetical protein